jgi:hypothetical protein
MARRGMTCEVVGVLLDRVTLFSASILFMGGTAPGVLFLVIRRWILGAIFRRRFDVGFLDFIIGGASVMRVMETIGVSSITRCCRSVSVSTL